MSYAKAIFPYRTDIAGDLTLQVDDVIEVTSSHAVAWLTGRDGKESSCLQVLAEIDGNWLRGRFQGQIGLVPCQFIERLPCVQLDEHQSLYIAHTDYRSSHAEDLQFHRGTSCHRHEPLLNLRHLGDLLIVHEHLPNGWFRGSLHVELPGTSIRPTGIFPSTFVNLLCAKSNSTEHRGKL